MAKGRERKGGGKVTIPPMVGGGGCFFFFGEGKKEGGSPPRTRREERGGKEKGKAIRSRYLLSWGKRGVAVPEMSRRRGEGKRDQPFRWFVKEEGTFCEMARRGKKGPQTVIFLLLNWPGRGGGERGREEAASSWGGEKRRRDRPLARMEKKEDVRRPVAERKREKRIEHIIAAKETRKGKRGTGPLCAKEKGEQSKN